ncbi:Phage integrase family protein, partial [Oceanobacillus limi]
RKAAKHVNLVNIGTHTLRKTFGYHLYKQTGDVALLQKILNHSDPAFTLRYIGIDQDAMNKAIKEFKI